MYAAPMKLGVFCLALCCVGVGAFSSTAEVEGEAHSTVKSGSATLSNQAVRKAAVRAIGLVDQSSAKFLEIRNCFTCHTQTMSAMVLKDAREAGFEIDEGNFKRQVKRALTLHSELNGIRVDTVGYGLWALDIGEHPADDMTKDMVQYLLDYKKKLGHWGTTVDRPPAETSDFTTNYVAVRGLNRYGTAEQRDDVLARIDAVERWLSTATAKNTEDHVFWLRLAYELKLESASRQMIVKKLLGEQRPDGGWAQSPKMKSDAYSTGSVLVALHEAGDVPCRDATWSRGLDYLVRTQKPDGSWRVTTRAEPLQVYFESGFPHGKDQFISVYATGWATKALLVSLRVNSQQ